MARFALFSLVLIASTAARAELLTLDLALLQDAARVLGEQAGESSGESGAAAASASLLPAALESSRAVASQSPAGRQFGIGLQVGAPTALTIKYMVAADQGLVVGVGAGFGWRGGFGVGLSIHADYLFHVAQLIRNDALTLSAYLGPGLWLTVFNGGYGFGGGYYYAGTFGLFGVGVRVPMGLNMAFNAAPIEIYLELDPALFLFPGIDFGIGASLGFRFYF